MKQILVLFLLFTFSFAQAGSIEDANKICKSMQDLQDQEQCSKFLIESQQLVEKYYDLHYDTKAIDTCASLSDQRLKKLCLINIEGKHYTEREIKTCSSNVHEYNIMECLEYSGR